MSRPVVRVEYIGERYIVFAHDMPVHRSESRADAEQYAADYRARRGGGRREQVGRRRMGGGRAGHLDAAIRCLRGGIGQAEIVDTVTLLHPSEVEKIDRERELGRYVVVSHVGVKPDGTYRTERCGRFYRVDDARAALATAGYALRRDLGVWVRDG